MKISVIVCAYNEEKYIGKTLESISKSAGEELLEIVVVNNASTDRTSEVANRFPKVRVVNETQKGLTKARQAGLVSAKGDILSYLDADTLVNKQWFDVLKKEFSQNSDLVCLSGPYIYYGLPNMESFFVRIWTNFWIWLWHWFIFRIAASKRGYVIMGGNFTAKREALLKAGGFDSSIAFYGEDTDIARRLSLVGRVKFIKEFAVQTSARRFESEGLIWTAVKYLANYLSVVFIKKPVTSSYSDIR